LYICESAGWSSTIHTQNYFFPLYLNMESVVLALCTHVVYSVSHANLDFDFHMPCVIPSAENQIACETQKKSVHSHQLVSMLPRPLADIF
jgi:hypothetical protein